MTGFHVFSKDNCPQCDQAKQLLNVKKEEYIVTNVGKDMSREEFIEMFPRARTFPVVLYNREIIGGLPELMKYIQNKELEGMSL